MNPTPKGVLIVQQEDEDVRHGPLRTDYDHGTGKFRLKSTSGLDGKRNAMKCFVDTTLHSTHNRRTICSATE